MADDADKAAEIQAEVNRSAASYRRPESGVQPEGYCHACGEDIGPGRLFCNGDCADEHERMERQRRNHG